METRRVSEGLETKQFQRHPALTRPVTKYFETICSDLESAKQQRNDVWLVRIINSIVPGTL
jgi:hypothetical protein